MFKVECPGCKAPYQVDERRIPSSGLKMRCPKCGTSFKVDPSADPQQTGPSPVLGGALGIGADSVPPPALPARPARSSAAKSTMLGIAPSGAGPRVAGGAVDLPSPARAEVDLPSPAGRRNAPPPPPPPRRAPPPPAATQPRLDLDAPRAESAGLPAPRAAADLPAVAQRRAATPSPLELDLPSVTVAKGGPAAAASPPIHGGVFGELELDLPSAGEAAAARQRPPPPPAFDLPSPTPAPRREISLPSLPSPASNPLRSPVPPKGQNDLPSLGDSALPSVGNSVRPSVSDPALPSIRRSGLPSISNSGLPSAGRSALPSLSDLGLPTQGASLPAPPALGARVAAPSGSFGAPAPAFGELELPLITANSPPHSVPTAPLSPRGEDALEVDPFGEAVLAPPRSMSGSFGAADSALPPAPVADAVVRQGGGGTAYGELNLGVDSDGEFPLEAPLPEPTAEPRRDEDMEFANVPQEQAPIPAPADATARMSVPARKPERAPARTGRSKAAPRVFASLFVVLLGGAALSLVPSVGPFGAYWALDQINAGEHARLVAATVAGCRKLLGEDTAPAAQRAMAQVDAVRGDAKRVRALTAYAALLGGARELRFGADAQTRARVKVMLAELEGHADVPYSELALAARAATEGQLARARQSLRAILRTAPADVEALVLSGEVELRARDANAALVAWGSLANAERSARAAFGLARARFAANDAVGAERDAKQALQRNPEHVGARVLLARIASSGSAREAEALAWLEEIARIGDKASADELVSAHTLLGDIHLSRARISRAEAAYSQALNIDPKAARALTGMAEALYRAGRYSEAQARFEAGAQADPDDVLAKVGVAKSKLMLERLEEAQASLKTLKDSHPKSLLVTYWYGRVLEASGNREQAEQIYVQGLSNPGSDPMLVDTYIALALLQTQQGKIAQAEKTLSSARERLPDSPSIHRALGEVALSQGRYADARTELDKALALDPDDLGARFRMGITLRHQGSYDAALKSFEAVAAVDPHYPGLALERGSLFEASGRQEEALKAYEGALAKAPDDPDLMLRVGCGYAGAGRPKEAQELLRKVLALRPTSAETNHCFGRALLAQGSRLADALRSLDRAVELDGNRAEYHLYAGWAANEAGNVLKAERALDQAIKLDQSLADAYWQRGVLRARQGALRDAIADLTRALQLRPSRHEAHATLADAYYDLGKEQQALAEWQLAVAAVPDNATWHFRYGKLLVANHMNEAAREELAKALDLATKSPKGERWLWEAHHLMARALGSRAEAASHWEEFLRLGPLDSPYRPEAKLALEKLGRPWSGK